MYVSRLPRIKRPLPPPSAIPIQHHRYGRQRNTNARQHGKPAAVSEPLDQRARGKREEGAHQTPRDDHRRHARGRVHAQGVDDIGHDGQVAEHHGEAQQGDAGQHGGQREAGLRDPAVGGDGDGQGQAAEDDEREAVLGRVDAVVRGAQVDVDAVEVDVADGDHQQRADAEADEAESCLRWGQAVDVGEDVRERRAHDVEVGEGHSGEEREG